MQSKNAVFDGITFTRCANGAVLPGSGKHYQPKFTRRSRHEIMLDRRTGKYFIARRGKILRPPTA